MKVSVITATNNAQWLPELYKSLQDQTYENWEWIIVPNNGAQVNDFDDKRVKIYPIPVEVDRIGALKYYACKQATGDIILEVDHDDLILSECMREVVKVFASDDSITMVHSNDCHVNMDTWEVTQVWDGRYGWKYRPYKYNGYFLQENIAPKAIPQNMSRIWYAPDHLRAWRTKDYWRIGGHDQSMLVADDHELTIRNYLHGKIAHIDKVLYIYRVHPDNNVTKHNKQIQIDQWANYDRYIYDLVAKWADDNKLKKVDLGGGLNPIDGYIRVDANNEADITANLEDRWPFEDNSIGVFRAHDIVEHLRDPIHTMNEAWRCLAHGGFFMVLVPSTDGRGAFQDPTHLSFWNENSFLYYTQAGMQKYIAHKTDCKYQAMKIETFYPSDFLKAKEIPYVRAHLIALKDGDNRFHGIYDW